MFKYVVGKKVLVNESSSSAQCQPVAESEAVDWAARGSRRTVESSEFHEGEKYG